MFSMALRIVIYQIVFISIIASINCSGEEHNMIVSFAHLNFGTQTKSRYRKFCCSDDVPIPQTMGNCLNFCNMANNWDPKGVIKPCHMYFTGPCKKVDIIFVCIRGFKGDCCCRYAVRSIRV